MPPSDDQSFAMSTRVEALQLGNIHETINEQFADAIAQIAETFQDESHKHTRDFRKASITLKIDFKYALETRSTSIEATLSAKLPGYRGVAQVVRLPRGGERLLIEVDDATQMDMYTPNPDTDVQ